MDQAVAKWDQAVALKTEYKAAVKLINKLLVKEIDQAFQSVPTLHAACRHLVDAGGKRIRAVIPMWVCGANGRPQVHAMHVGVAIELIHTFTLIHDDIMDDANQRRGVESVHVKFGVPTAINAGDALFALGMNVIHKAGTGAFSEYDLPVVFSEAMLNLPLGQQMDLEARKDEAMSVLEYQEMVSGKTAALFEVGGRAGSMVGFMGDRQQSEMAEFGRNFGIMFQLRDDQLDGDFLLDGQPFLHAYRDRALKNLQTCTDRSYRELLIALTKAQVARRE